MGRCLSKKGIKWNAVKTHSCLKKKGPGLFGDYWQIIEMKRDLFFCEKLGRFRKSVVRDVGKDTARAFCKENEIEFPE